MPSSKFGTKALNAELRRLSSEVVTVLDDGTQVTRAEQLAKMIWDLALGGERRTRDADGNMKTVIVLPVAWAQQFLFERIEGKSVPTQTENESGIRAVDKVSQLAKDRINKMATTVAGPPTHKPKK